MLRQSALTTALALVVGASWAGNALADVNAGQEVQATVYAAGASPVTDSTTVGQLEANCPTYAGPSDIPLYEDNGNEAPQQLVSSESWTLGTLVTCFQTPIDVASITGITVDGPTGPQLGVNSLVTPSDLVSPENDPVVFSDGTNLNYVRPRRSGSDANADDDISLNAATQFTFSVYEGPLLTVAISPTTPVTVGTTVQFVPTVTPTGESGLTYSWSFDGVAPDSSQLSPSVTFSSEGTFAVTLHVIDTAGGGGATTISVTVGQLTTPPASKHPQPTGPLHSRGAARGTKPGHHTRHDATTSGRHHTTKTSHSTTITTPSTATAPVASTPVNTPPTSTILARPVTATPAPASVAVRSAAPVATHRSGAPASGSTHVVTGRLVGDIVTLPAAASPLVRELAPESATALPLRSAIAGSVLPSLGAGLGVLMLLGLGAGRELLGRRHPWA